MKEKRYRSIHWIGFLVGIWGITPLSHATHADQNRLAITEEDHHKQPLSKIEKGPERPGSRTTIPYFDDSKPPPRSEEDQTLEP